MTSSTDISQSDQAQALRGVARPTPQDFDIRIAADGNWYHEGGLIGRPALVKLFASVLCREDDGSYWLVTPVERGRIKVDDVPFIIVAAGFEGGGENQLITLKSNVGDEIILGEAQVITLSSNVGEEITLGEAHELVMRQNGGGEDAKPYVSVRPGLEGRLARPVYYELAERSTAGPDGRFGVWSAGRFFALESDLA